MKSYSSPRTVIMTICILITIISVAATSQLSNDNLVANAGNFISLHVAQSSNFTNEQLFGAEQINYITSQRDYAGLRIYYSKGQIMLVGTDAQGNDLTDMILSFGMEGVGEKL